MLIVYGLRQETLMLDTLPCTGDLCMVSEEVCVIEVLLHCLWIVELLGVV